MKSEFRVYDSVGEFCGADIKNLDSDYARINSWSGDRNLAESQKYFMAGASDKETKSARDLLDKIDVEVHGHMGDVWTPAVQGAYPCVADWLRGAPTSMRDKVRDETETAPLRVVLNISVAAGVPVKLISQRASAAAAFAMKLSEHRPVELWIASAFHNDHVGCDVGFRVKLDMPINLSQVIAAYNPSVCRLMNFTYLDSYATNNSGIGTRDCYPFTLKNVSAYSRRDQFVQHMREYMHLEPDDIVLDAGILTDCSLIDANPVQWVKDMLAKYGEATED